MTGAIDRTERKIGHRHRLGREQCLQFSRPDLVGIRGRGRPGRTPGSVPVDQPGKPVLQHEHLVPTHLAQPRGGHRRSHTVAIGQHQPGAADTDMLVGGLHQLPARDRREG